MDFKRIIGELDQEIEKLRQIRAIVAKLAHSAHRQRLQPKPKPRIRAQNPLVLKLAKSSEPQLTVLPPKTRREYHRRSKVAQPMPRALATPISLKPVFVARVSLTNRPGDVPKTRGITADALEAVMKQNLLGNGSKHGLQPRILPSLTV